MNDWSLVDDGRGTGVKWWIKEDEDSDQILIKSEQDYTPFTDLAKELQADGFTGWNKDKTFKHVAFLPFEFMHKLKTDHGIDVLNPHHWNEAYKKILNEPDYAHLRTGKGRI